MYQHIRELILRAGPSSLGIAPTGGLARIVMMGSLAAVLSLLGIACGSAATPEVSPVVTLESSATPRAVARIKVVATNTVLADLARNVGGDLVEVSSLVPPGADIHAFQTTPAHSVAIGQAQVVISNGFNLDDFLVSVLRSARQPGSVHVVAAEGLDAELTEELHLEFLEVGEEQESHPGHGEEFPVGDPHFWLDPVLAIHYVERIRDGLTQADPARAAEYSTNAERYIQEIRDLDRELVAILNQVPPERRHLVTLHDAYGYFGRRYGWKVSAFVPSDASDVTPGAIVEVISRIQVDGIPAIFAESQFSSDVLDQAARETGARVGLIHSLVNDTAPTYLDMMRANAQSLAEHLR